MKSITSIKSATPEESGPKSKYLYFICTSELPNSQSFIKIGVASSPEDRLRQLQTSCPHRLDVYGTVGPTDLAHDIEGQVHAILFRHRERGEWFKWHREVIALADLLSTIGWGDGMAKFRKIRLGLSGQ